MTNRKNTKDELRDVDKFLIQTVMFQHGIIPMEKTKFDMRRALEQLPKDEARALKRKFRKMWRKAMREEIGNGAKTKDARERSLKYKLGVGKRVPSRDEKNARKELVFNLLWDDVIEPLVKKFENV